jgi:hypothetical protein
MVTFTLCPIIGQEEKFNQTFTSGLIDMAVTRVTIPGTDLNVSRICLGTWQFNDNTTYCTRNALLTGNILADIGHVIYSDRLTVMLCLLQHP